MKFAVFAIQAGLLCAADEVQARRHLAAPGAFLTEPSSAPAGEIGRGYLASVAGAYGLDSASLDSLYVERQYTTEHNGVTHVLYRQRYRGIDVENAAWSVNLDRAGRVLSAGGQLFPTPDPALDMPDASGALAAVRVAVGAVNPKSAASWKPFHTGKAQANRLQFGRGSMRADIEGELIYWGARGRTRPAWLFFVAADGNYDRFAVVVDSQANRVISKKNFTLYQNAPRALVFDKGSPQPNPNPGTRLTAAPPFVPRADVALTGDAVSSPLGWVAANQTSGNNTVTGANPVETFFLKTPILAEAANGNFNFPLQTGPGAPPISAYRSASTVNLFYWVNKAHDMFYQAGFNEAAGNYQANNLGRGGQDGDPLYAYNHFGSQLSAFPDLGNSFYTTQRFGRDGATSMIAMFLNSTAETGAISDGALDAEVIVHEYTHGVSTRLISSLFAFQGRAMQEGWSDYFGLDATIPPGAPADGVYTLGGYFFQDFQTGGGRSRPYSTNTDVNPLTFANFGKVIFFPEVHADGEIWFEALWEVRAAMIKQYGDAEGRRRARLLVIDGMKLTPPEPTFVDARNGILMADRVDFGGANQAAIWAAFAKRGLGVLADTRNPDSVRGFASFATPSSKAVVQFTEKQYTIGEVLRIVLNDADLKGESATVQLTGSSGDVETVLLTRVGQTYIADVQTTYAGSTGVTKENSLLQLIPGDLISVYYNDVADGKPAQISATVPAAVPYAFSQFPQSYTFANETALFTRADISNSIFLGTLLQRKLILPFQFPFYGESYGTATVFMNGLISFDGNGDSFCPSGGAFASTTAIAPLFADLVIGGGAQPNENIYVSRTTDSITFRWAAEAFLDIFDPNDPPPVNMAATLFNDGKIEYRYGAGNKGFVKNDFFCGPMFSTVGVSNGRETGAQVFRSYDGAQIPLEKAPSIRIDPPGNFGSIPKAILERPTAAQQIKGVIQGQGIVYDEQLPVLRVDVLIDGIAVTRAQTGQPRADFCATQNVPGCPRAGFVFAVNGDALKLTAGTHRMQLRATNTRGAFLDFPEKPLEFNFAPADTPPLPTGKIETPLENSELSATTPVRGYIIGQGVSISTVDVLIDGITYGRASYGQSRTDVCAGVPAPSNCPNVGFTFNLNTVTGFIVVPNGPHNMQVRARDSLGRLTLIPAVPLPFTVKNTENKPPTGVLTSPTNGQRVKGTIAVSGYAYDPDGRVTAVTLWIDDEPWASVPYGRPRPAECATLKDVTACPNIGFDVDFDTRRIQNGLHGLKVTVRDDKGVEVNVPKTNEIGINIIVEN